MSSREGLAAVISIHELLTNQILLFNVETVAAPWLQYVRLLFWMVQFTVAHKQAVNNGARVKDGLLLKPMLNN